MQKAETEVQKAETEVQKAKMEAEVQMAKHLEFRLSEMEAAYLHAQGNLQCRLLIKRMESKSSPFVKKLGGIKANWTAYAEASTESVMVRMMQSCMTENGMDSTPKRLGAAVKAMYAHFSERIHLPQSIQNVKDFIVHVPPRTSEADICPLTALVGAPDELLLKNTVVKMKAIGHVDPVKPAGTVAPAELSKPVGQAGTEITAGLSVSHVAKGFKTACNTIYTWI
jgi:hypothetical protein